MTPVAILGWVAATVGILLGLPQLLHLIRTRRTEGVSLIAWQILLVLNLAWASHGIVVGQANMVLTNVFALFSTVPILVLMTRQRGLSLPKVLLPSRAGAALMIVIDLMFGPVAYGVAAAIPGAVVNLAQSVELIRSRSVAGVSPIFMVFAVVNQLLWGSWGWLVPEVGTIIAASMAAGITTFNLAWWILRRRGLRAFFPYPEAEAAPVEVESLA